MTLEVNARYQIKDKVGKGGMGDVYKALDRLTGQTVALKIVTMPNWSPTLDLRLALAQEFQLLSSLRHPNIISVLDYGFSSSSQPYFTMDLLETPLTLLDAAESSSIRQKILLIVQILQALLYLHRRGVIHRDLKPGNVLVTPEGQVKVLDFGLATEMETYQNPEGDTISGTPAYMSPELMQGGAPSEASDLFAVGVIAYEMLAGHHPFDGGDLNALLYNVMHAEPDMNALITRRFNKKLRKTDTSGDMTSAYVNLKDADPVVLPEDSTRPFSAVSNEALSAKTQEIWIDDETPTNVPPPVFPTEELKKITRPMRMVEAEGKIRGEEGQPFSSDMPVAAIIHKLLQKKPENRYRDAEEVIRDLSAALGEPLPVETVATRESFLQASVFVGRENELNRLREMLNEAKAGRGCVVFVAGESGVGKTRLNEELRIQALVGGAVVVRGQASTQNLPFEVWRDPLRRLLLETTVDDTDAATLRALIPDIDMLIGRAIPPTVELTPEETQKRLLDVISSVLHQQKQPVVIILEDLQWANSESLAILNRVAQSIHNVPVLILGSYRDDEVSPVTAFTTPENTLRLHRLKGEPIAQLSASMIGEAGRKPDILRYLERETEGNIFFLIEIVRALAEEAGGLSDIGLTGELPTNFMTGGLQQVVQKRLNRVPRRYYPLLQIAAAVGRQLDLAVLRQAAPEVDLDHWLTACSSAAVVEVQDGRWQFAHDKLREGVNITSSETQLANVHRKVALALETVYPDNSAYAAALAGHWRQVGDAVKERHYVMAAGEQAYRLSANQEALSFYERALALLPDDDVRRISISARLAEIKGRLGKLNEAQQLLESLLPAAQHDLRLKARILNTLGNVLVNKGQHPEAAQMFNDSLALLNTLGENAAETLILLGHVSADLGDYEQAFAQFEEGLKAARKAENAWNTARALNALGRIKAMQGNFDEAEANLNESIALYRAIGNKDGVGLILLNLGTLSAYQGDMGSAKGRFQEGLHIFREINSPFGITAALTNLGMAALHEQQFAQAYDQFMESLTLLKKIEDPFSIANLENNLGHAMAGMGDNRQARCHYREALRGSHAVGAVPITLEALAGIAKLSSGQDEKLTRRLIALVHRHPGTNAEIKAMLGDLAADVEAIEIDPQALKDELDAVVETVLGEG